MASVTELQQQLNTLIEQLSPERLQLLTDCAAYLVEEGSEAATQEVLSIPGLLERVQQLRAAPKADYQNWRTLRSDV